ncbi:glycosyltransferase [Salegentibacter sp. UBA1130]|uniref:glycosyltransferase n=1 Tax=Salegentibacter sp. UBA1130 TaxID=1947451 RepID=UPI0025808AE5|nr:glycosyltransferase [Salegentibacter sp. UBA1130]
MKAQKKINIAFIVKGFPTLSQTFIVNQIVALLKEDHEVDIFAFRKGDLTNLHPDIAKYHLLDRVTYKEEIPPSKKRRVKDLLLWAKKNFFHIHWRTFLHALLSEQYNKKTFLNLFYNSKWFLAGQKYDIVHAHFGDNSIPIAYLKEKGILKGVKFVVTFHGYDLTPTLISYYKHQYKEIFEHADAFTVNTPYTKDLLLKVKPHLQNINILPVGLDPFLFQRENKLKNNFRILFCGRLIPLKGPFLLLEIIAELKRRGFLDVELEIIGDGECKGKLKEKVEQMNIEKNVFFSGALDQLEVKYSMEDASVLLHPGIYDPQTGRAETQGLVIQEAQAMGLPVVVSDVGGMKYGLIPGETGFVVKENDISGFADAIEELILSKELGEKMGKRGREFVEKNYDSSVLVKKLLDLYRTL